MPNLNAARAGQPCEFNTLATLWYDRGFSFLHFAAEAATKGLASTPPRNTIQVLYRGALTRLVQPSCVAGSSLPCDTVTREPVAGIPPGAAAASAEGGCNNNAEPHSHDGAHAPIGQPIGRSSELGAINCAQGVPNTPVDHDQAAGGQPGAGPSNQQNFQEMLQTTSLPRSCNVIDTHDGPHEAAQPCTAAADPVQEGNAAAVHSVSPAAAHRGCKRNPETCAADSPAPNPQSLSESEPVRTEREADCNAQAACATAGALEIEPDRRSVVDLTTASKHPFISQVRRKNLPARVAAPEPSNVAPQRRTPSYVC